MITIEDFRHYSVLGNKLHFTFDVNGSPMALSMTFSGELSEESVMNALPVVVDSYNKQYGVGPAPAYMLQPACGGDRNFMACNEKDFDVVRKPHWRQDRDDESRFQ